MTAELNRRQRRLWRLFDFGQGRGLEVGPLHNTVVPRSLADVSYVDVYDREGLLSSYADDPGVDPEAIPEMDFSLFDGERVRSLPEAVGDAAPFDWVMASHVIEHVPDLIGWLQELAEVTVDGGHLLLAVPDRRYCFDLHRPGTTVGQLIEAHERGDVVPSVRAVYDYKRGHASVHAEDVWAGRVVGYGNRIYRLDEVLADVERARRGEYVDAHVGRSRREASPSSSSSCAGSGSAPGGSRSGSPRGVGRWSSTPCCAGSPAPAGNPRTSRTSRSRTPRCPTGSATRSPCGRPCARAGPGRGGSAPRCAGCGAGWPPPGARWPPCATRAGGRSAARCSPPSASSAEARDQPLTPPPTPTPPSRQ